MLNNLKKILKRDFESIEPPNIQLKEETYNMCKQNTLKMKRKILLQPILISFIAIVVLFSSTFAVSAEFRNMIISFFKSSDTEIVPENPGGEETIEFIGKQSIDGIANIRYIELNGAFVLNNNTAVVRVADNLKYYKIDGEEIKELEFVSTHISDIIIYKGIEFPLEFDYGVLDGNFYVENTLETMAKSYLTSIVGHYGTEQVWVELGIEQSPPYYILYNLETGQVTDIIEETLGDVHNIGQFEISPNSKKIIIGSENFYLLDIENKNAISINEITGLNNIASCTFINDDLISITQKASKIKQSIVAGQMFAYNSYTYNFATGEKLNIFNDGELYNSSTGTATGYIALGKGFYIQKIEEQYIFINPLGEKYPIEGLKPSDGIDFLLSPDQTKVAVTNISGKGNGGLKITELGIIDVEKKELKIFDRKDFNNNYETSFFWNDNNSLAVTAENQSQYIYIYKFK